MLERNCSEHIVINLSPRAVPPLSDGYRFSSADMGRTSSHLVFVDVLSAEHEFTWLNEVLSFWSGALLVLAVRLVQAVPRNYLSSIEREHHARQLDPSNSARCGRGHCESSTTELLNVFFRWITGNLRRSTHLTLDCGGQKSFLYVPMWEVLN